MEEGLIDPDAPTGEKLFASTRKLPGIQLFSMRCCTPSYDGSALLSTITVRA